MFIGPGTLKVYVPPKPPPKSEDLKRDFPTGFPPEVYYQDAKASYWVVLREEQMDLWNRKVKFNQDQVAWLRSIEDQVEEIIRHDH